MARKKGYGILAKHTPQDILAIYRRTGTLDDTGAVFGVTRERIRQILRKEFGDELDQIEAEASLLRKSRVKERARFNCATCGKESFRPGSKFCSTACSKVRAIEEASGFKKCTRCGKVKPLSGFYPNYKKDLSPTESHYRPDCKPCQYAVSAKWKEANRDKVRVTAYKAVRKYVARKRLDPVWEAEQKVKRHEYYIKHREYYLAYFKKAEQKRRLKRLEAIVKKNPENP